MSLSFKIIAGLSAFLPLVTLAEPGATYDNYFEGVAATADSVISTLLPAMIGLVIIGFAYGLFVYITGAEADKAKGKSIIVWGGLAVVVLLSIYGIAGLLQNIFGATESNITIPTTFKK